MEDQGSKTKELKLKQATHEDGTLVVLKYLSSDVEFKREVKLYDKAGTLAHVLT